MMIIYKHKQQTQLPKQILTQSGGAVAPVTSKQLFIKER